MRWNSITELKKEADNITVQGSIYAQLTQKLDKITKTGKPYLELHFADISSSFALKVWDNAAWYAECQALSEKSCLELQAGWFCGSYGMEASDLRLRPLSEQEQQELLSGNPELIAKQQTDWDYIQQRVHAIHDPRLRYLCRSLLDTFGERFRRCGAARSFHHARRGGLVEHVAGIMRAGHALCQVYTEVNEDLLMAGILFHDSGKMWENQYEENGFTMPYTEVAELLGHIPIGIEMLNKFWSFIMTPARRAEWASLQPPSEKVRMHLLHLVASHHGELQFGSPVVPKTPEAVLLHYLDNMDAKLEMFRDAYANSAELAPQVYQRRAPLAGNEVAALPRYSPPATESSAPEASAPEA